MILYVNGDSHAAAAEAVNPHAFAEDDGDLLYLGRLPHPENLAVSWGRTMADALKYTFKCDAESAASNDRILRTTQEWMEDRNDLDQMLMVIQWSTWERTEWLIDGRYYQITASGTDDVPADYQQQYKQFVVDTDWRTSARSWHDRIWEFHQRLLAQGIQHVFFNGNSHFGSIDPNQRQDWGSHYIEPYAAAGTYDAWLKSRGHHTVSPESWHFGREAHAAWARFMLQYAIAHKLV